MSACASPVSRQSSSIKTYKGNRSRSGCIVTVNGERLDPRLDLLSHSPDGFEWGYYGSGPAQLALALLADCLADNTKAIVLHQEYKRAVVSALPHSGWTLTSNDIKQAVAALDT